MNMNDNALLDIALAGPIVCKDAHLRVVTAPVLIPGEADSDGEILPIEKIEEVALKWLEDYRLVDIMHTFKKTAVPVESWTLREESVFGDVTLPKGTWMVSAKIKDIATWAKILNGELTGFSVTGMRRRDLEAASKSANPENEFAEKSRKTLLRDLGPDWLAVTVSIVDDPAVYKSKWVAIKSKEAGDTLFNRLANAAANTIGKVTGKSKTKLEVNEMEKEEIVTIVEELLAKKSKEESDKLATEKAAAEAKAKAEKELSEKSAEDLKKVITEKDAQIAALGTEVATVKEELGAFKSKVNEKLAVKSKGLYGQDGDAPPPTEKDTANKSAGESRDFFGRQVKKRY